jgi:hypothetical protein
MALEQFSNDAKTTLTGTIGPLALTLTVTSATNFPAQGNFRIRVENEIMLVTAVGGTVFTVTRGVEGTTAASHTAGVAVTHVVTSGALSQFRSDNVGSGLLSSRPGASREGALYLPTDGYAMYRDSGASWFPYGPVLPLSTPPTAGSLTLRQTGTNAALTDSGEGLYLEATSRGVGEDAILADMVLPATPFTLTVGFLPLLVDADQSAAGVVAYEAGTAKYNAFLLYTDGTGLRAQTRHATGLTGAPTFTQDTTGYALSLGPLRWMQLADDGTNRTYRYSTDGTHFVTYYSELRTVGFTVGPDRVGVALNPRNQSAAMQVVSWKVT